ncbi:hypothetical protein MY04_2665 [Flammeovirga sp. MY04]|uniref:hypothetical protein n=1 Tax=Flammeovirga sp. MY04 TaxID=1191459 RepID=UPI0008062A2E|nr:hypothetical protein [Flammeovirga sp. MY04]ANQ50034.1 hypothetical protein MY04_2665 [Flammeovirga sp. MY04]
MKKLFIISLLSLISMLHVNAQDIKKELSSENVVEIKADISQKELSKLIETYRVKHSNNGTTVNWSEFKSTSLIKGVFDAKQNEEQTQAEKLNASAKRYKEIKLNDSVKQLQENELFDKKSKD